jgi:hypothetical protein
MERVKQLIREILSTPPKKESCNCGCHSCENVGNKGPVLNESLNAKIVMTENMQYHITNKLPLTENTFRYGSQAFLDLWAEARYLYSRNAIHVNDDDKEILLETNLGEYGMYEGKKVPLDLPMLEENEIGGEDDMDIGMMSSAEPIIQDLYNLAKQGNKKAARIYDELVQAITPEEKQEIINKYFPERLNEVQKKKKTPPIGKPKRGGSKKFYVYVRDKGKIKKVSFGDTTGLSSKINNPKARKAFAARHDCKNKKDKTKASYWSCRLPRYAKLLGLKSSFSGFW